MLDGPVLAGRVVDDANVAVEAEIVIDEEKLRWASSWRKRSSTRQIIVSACVRGVRGAVYGYRWRTAL